MALDERIRTGKRKAPAAMRGAWARITVPVAGAIDDAPVIDWAVRLAEVFDADLNLVFAPPDPAELSPWLGEGYMGTVQMATIDSLRAAGDEGERRAQAQFDAIGYDRRAFVRLVSPVWQDLALEARLSDLVVFGNDAAVGRGLLAEAFTQVLMEERCGVFIARRAFDPAGVAVVAWDGKEPSSRAARRAVPRLKQAQKVIVAGAPIGDHPPELERLGAYYAAHGLEVGYERLPKGEVCKPLVEICERHGADYMVAGAFGRSRVREFAFGGTTRQLLQKTSLNLYMAH
jgi:nucleotide-binding universal stress UspA family protein